MDIFHVVHKLHLYVHYQKKNELESFLRSKNKNLPLNLKISNIKAISPLESPS